MAKTLVEQNIRHKRHRSGILVPFIEDRLKRPIRIETSKDIKFMKQLWEKNMLREEDRVSERMYSPSALAECLRKVYLTKNFEAEGIPRVFPPKIQPNYYFLTGEFIHLKWQFALYKMAQEFPEIELASDPIDSFEVRVVSKRGDHGGTADAIPCIMGKHYVVDYKGLNVRTFSKISIGEVPDSYRIQIADYMILLNSERPRRFQVEDALLVAESKGGPDTHHPAALCEARISLTENKAEVRGRLEILREHEKENTIPEPECITTKGVQFQGCPFQGYCKEEVKEIERRKSKGGNSNGYKVSVPKRRRANSSR
jgi:hypothetical protein